MENDDIGLLVAALDSLIVAGIQAANSIGMAPAPLAHLTAREQEALSAIRAASNAHDAQAGIDPSQPPLQDAGYAHVLRFTIMAEQQRQDIVAASTAAMAARAAVAAGGGGGAPAATPAAPRIGIGPLVPSAGGGAGSVPPSAGLGDAALRADVQVGGTFPAGSMVTGRAGSDNQATAPVSSENFRTFSTSFRVPDSSAAAAVVDKGIGNTGKLKAQTDILLARLGQELELADTAEAEAAARDEMKVTVSMAFKPDHQSAPDPARPTDEGVFRPSTQHCSRI